MINLEGRYFDGRHPFGPTATLTLSEGRASLTNERRSLQYDVSAQGRRLARPAPNG
jgi:hypothetical protein